MADSKWLTFGAGAEPRGERERPPEGRILHVGWPPAASLVGSDHAGGYLLRGFFVVLLTFTLLGCSSGYHQWFCRCVPYDYCRPCPLCYGDYGGCETPWAAKYAQQVNATDIPVAATEASVVDRPTSEASNVD